MRKYVIICIALGLPFIGKAAIGAEKVKTIPSSIIMKYKFLTPQHKLQYLKLQELRKKSRQAKNLAKKCLLEAEIKDTKISLLRSIILNHMTKHIGNLENFIDKNAPPKNKTYLMKKLKRVAQQVGFSMNIIQKF